MAEGVTPVETYHHDVVVVGGSAGGLEPLQRLLADLPSDLPAAIFVVLHLGATSHLADILRGTSILPVQRASSGEPTAYGKVYVAVPGVHLLLHDSHILLRRGPRENWARPAIDPLFRSAAATFGSRVIGVILSGALNDGAAGIRAVKQCGGIAVVQHPVDAAYPSMPLNAMRHTDVDHIVPMDEVGKLLGRLVREPAGVSPQTPFAVKLEAAIAAQELGGMAVEDKLGTPSRFTCPECHGALWEIDDGSLLRYRCHVGHAFTAEIMLAKQAEQAEELLWSLMRAHQERAALARRMADQEHASNREKAAQELRAKALGYEEDAAVIRSLLRDDADVDKQAGDEPGG